MNKMAKHDLTRFDRELRFLRRSPREHESIPFADDIERMKRNTDRDALIGFITLVAMLMSLVFMPEWFT